MLQKKVYWIHLQYAFFLCDAMKENVPWPSIIDLLCPNVPCMTALGPHGQIYTGYRSQEPHSVHCAPAVSRSSYVQNKEASLSVTPFRRCYTTTGANSNVQRHVIPCH